MRAVLKALTICLPALGAVTPALAEDFPLTLQNCGQSITLAAPPERIVAIKSTAAELVIALGARAQLVGAGFLDAPLPEGGPSVAILSEKMPSTETVLSAAPGLVYSGWESAFTGDAVGERPFLGGLGIATYVSPPACRSVPPPKLGFDAVFAEIAEMGRILGRSAEAEALIAEQKAMLAGLAADPRGLTALWYSSGTKVPYVGAGQGAPQMVLEALGLTNIFAQIPEGWASASWEAVLDADPDVIVLVDAAWNSAEQKRRLLAENPLTAQLSAVKDGRYLLIGFPASEAGVRTVPATLDLAAQLAALGTGK